MAKRDYLAFIGTNSVRGSQGIYSLRLDGSTLCPEITAARQVYNAGALALHGDRLYAACEGMTFKGLADGGVQAYAWDKQGRLTETAAQRSFGQRTCAIGTDAERKNLYGANFYLGTWTAWPLDAAGDPGPARLVVAPPEDAGPFRALHCVQAIGKDYVGVISLAECALVIYAAADGRRVTSYAFPGHPFCRYLAVEGRYIYALMQDPGEIYVFRNHLEEDETIEWIQTISVQKEPLRHYGTTTLRFLPDGRTLIAATRGNSTLSLMERDEEGMLGLREVISLPGETPRDFAVSPDGRLVVTCLQKSNAICVHEVDLAAKTLRDTGWKTEIPSPASAAITWMEGGESA